MQTLPRSPAWRWYWRTLRNAATALRCTHWQVEKHEGESRPKIPKGNNAWTIEHEQSMFDVQRYGADSKQAIIATCTYIARMWYEHLTRQLWKAVAYTVMCVRWAHGGWRTSWQTLHLLMRGSGLSKIWNVSKMLRCDVSFHRLSTKNINEPTRSSQKRR